MVVHGMDCLVDVVVVFDIWLSVSLLEVEGRLNVCFGVVW